MAILIKVGEDKYFRIPDEVLEQYAVTEEEFKEKFAENADKYQGEVEGQSAPGGQAGRIWPDGGYYDGWMNSY